MKLTKLILFFVLISLFFACQQPEEYLIGVSQCSNDEWRSKMNMEMQHEAMFHKGVKLEIKSVSDDTEKQIADIKHFIDKKVDLIVVSPNQAEPVTPIVEKAYRAGIPVILVDRKIASENYTAFIGADNEQIGQEVGNYVAKLLNGKGNIVEIRGLSGSSPDKERHEGFAKAIAAYPGVRIVASADGAWLKNVAEEKFTGILAENPSIDLVFAHNDRMAIGAYNAAKRAGHAEANYHSPLFVGIDALPGESNGIQQVIDGKLKASFIYPTSGDKIIQLALNILENRKAAINHAPTYQKQNPLYTNVVDETNARVLKLQTDAILQQEDKIDFLDRQIGNYIIKHATQRYLLLVFAMICVIFIALFVLYFRAFNAKQRLNRELKIRNEEISRQKEQIEQHRDRLVAVAAQLEERLRQNVLSENVGARLITSGKKDSDKKFIEKLDELILQNIADENLNVED
ncbi:MAG: substrate-binding domain-containing protein, partial [Dysgonamonadaceae bacterium]|nr:substrate-binding domain-containing protein [Dysgonamonadaceae bacterium]